MNGILLVDKPSGMTSHDVVDRIRRVSRVKKVGHTGTLDPSATGLLILCLGTATRLSEHLMGMEKEYEGDIRLGVVTASHDMDGEILEEHPVPDLDAEKIQKVFDQFTGSLMQVPPMVSAVKVGGERLYKLARKGETVERDARPITVAEFHLFEYAAPLGHFRMHCTSGTYVRSLCHEVGQELGCGAALDSLRRTAVGRHLLDDSLPLNSFTSPEDVSARLVPMRDALDLPAVVVQLGGERLVASGIPLSRRHLTEDCTVQEGWIQIKSSTGELLAMGQVEQGPADWSLLPRRVFVKTR